MKVSGFTVIRNAQIMGYPIKESLQSLLPLVDELIIGIGQSDDGTKELINSINNPKIKTFDSIWDTTKTKGGLVLSEKTNEAMARCSGDWCFYLQADEVVHEKDYANLYKSMEAHVNDNQVEGLLFKYIHFYGSYGVVASARNWYRNEVRVIKNRKNLISVGDAQGFRVKMDTQLRKPYVKNANASIYHYGWVKTPAKMGEKNKHMFRWWHGNKYDDAFKDFAYKSGYGLKSYKGSHPAVMSELVKNQNWEFKPLTGPASWLGWNAKDFKNLTSDIFEKCTGLRIGEHKNYVLLK